MGQAQTRRIVGASVQAADQAGVQVRGFDPEDMPTEEYVSTRPSMLDQAARDAGPGFAIYADAHSILGATRYDAEFGCALDDIPAAGWVS